MKQDSHKPVVLIIHPGTLGDVMLSLTAIDRLRRRFQDHELIILVQGEIGEVLYEYDVVDRALNIDGAILRELFVEHPQLETDVAHVFSRCRYALIWGNDLDGRVFMNLQSLGVENICIVSPHDPSFLAIHQADRYCESLMDWERDNAEFGVPDPFRLRGDGQGGKKIFRVCPISHNPKVLMIHPGSGSRHKCLHPEKIGAIIRWLTKSQDFRIILCQGPADEKVFSDLQPYLNQIPHEILKNFNLIKMAKAIRKTDVFLGHDSGLTHLAAALGVPTIALFGPTDPQRWAPKGSNVEILQGPCCQCQDWNAVQQCSDKICLTHSIDDIVQAVDRLLADSRKVGHLGNVVKVT